MDELVAQFEKNATEVVRISLTEFRGRQLVDVRVYYTDDEGAYRPTRKGISLAGVGYLDYRNARPAYVERWMENLVNWEFAATNLAAL